MGNGQVNSAIVEQQILCEEAGLTDIILLTLVSSLGPPSQMPAIDIRVALR